MTKTRWQRIKRLYSAALDEPAAARTEFLAREAGGDEALRAAVEKLLRESASDDFLAAPDRPACVPSRAPDAAGGLDASPERPGARVGRYTLLTPLGEGGFAHVWLAEQEEPVRRRVALKLLKPEVAGAVTAERFLREVQLTATLQHPNILPLFDSGEAAGLPWYAMPFIEGESLRGRLARERQLGVAEAVRIARQVASALAHAHRRGVVHRDVKPENILLQDGHAYVADFGIALAVARADTGRLTQSGLLVGTPHYMSPEQATGAATLDGRTDQWAVGAILYEMLAGEPPHAGATMQALVARIVAEAPTPLAVVRPGVPAAVEAIVARTLQKVPADRFATTDELEEALAASEATLRTPAPGTAAGSTPTWCSPCTSTPGTPKTRSSGASRVAPRPTTAPTGPSATATCGSPSLCIRTSSMPCASWVTSPPTAASSSITSRPGPAIPVTT